MMRKTLFALLVPAVLTVLPSCLDETVKPVKEAPPVTVTWPEMTSEDDVIMALVLCYDNPRYEGVMSRYEALLHTEYFFELAPGDVVPGEDAAMTRAEDIASTAWIFENQYMLELAIISSGAWYEHPAVGEAACEGCRATTREYFIRAQFGREDRVYQSAPGQAFVTIVVAPDENDASKWVIRAIYDHGT